MALTKRGSTYHWNETINGERYRLSTGCTDKVSAQEWVRAALQRLKQGESLTPEAAPRNAPISTQMKLSVAFDKAQRTAWKGLAVAAGYDAHGRKIIELIGDLPLKDITTAKVTELKQALLCSEYATATVNRHLATLSSLLSVAVKQWDLPLRRPNFTLDREQNQRMRLFTKAEEIQAVQLATNQEMADLMTFLADSGCRLGEALKLTNIDIDLTQKIVRLWDTKNGDSRSVPLTKRLVALFERRDPKPFQITKDQATHQFGYIRTKIENGEDLVLHSFRHTCATNLLEAGVPIYTVQRWLGHKDIKTTMRYAKMTRSQLDVAAIMLDQFESSNEIILKAV
jgi:integrase